VYHPSGWGGGQTWKKFKWQTFATLPNILPHHLANFCHIAKYFAKWFATQIQKV
jgi:hypothetical protein